MTNDGDILFYGCDVGKDGGVFIGQLAKLTDADIAASSNKTGSTAKGGDWNLEIRQGDIDAPAFASPEMAQLYQSILAGITSTVTFQTTANFTDKGGSGNGTENVAYKVTGSSSYILQIDGHKTGVAYVTDYYNHYSVGFDGYAANTEDMVTFSFKGGQVFTPSTLNIDNSGGGAQSIVFRGYDASNNLVGTAQTFSINASDSTNAISLTGLTGITTLVVKQSTNGVLKGFLFDDIALANIQLAAAAPTLTSATYNATSGVLDITAADMTTGDSIDNTQLVLKGEGAATYTLTTTGITAASATQVLVTLNGTDKAALGLIMNKASSATSTGGATFNLAGGANWDSSRTTAADATNAVTVSSVPVPTITSSTYNANTGVLVVTGTGFLRFGSSSDNSDPEFDTK